MLNRFISEVKTRGLARTNRYVVEIPFPNSREYNIDDDSKRLTNLFCESIQLPGLNISTDPARTYGEAREMPYERTFETFSATFYVDTNMKVKTAFDNWMSMIIDPKTRTIGYYKDFVTDINVHIETLEQSWPLTFKIYEAYPKSVSPIQLNLADRDVMTFTVTFQYKYWVSDNHTIPTTQQRPSSFKGEADRQSVYAANGMGYGFDAPVVSEEEIVAVEDRRR